MSITFKVIAIILVLVGIFIPIAFIINNKKIKKKYSIIPILIGIIVFVFSCSFTIIPTGYTGVRSTFGQISKTTVSNGFNWKMPFIQSIEKVNNKQQDATYSGKIWSETSNRTALYYNEIIVTYQINPKKSAWIYANVSNYEDNLIAQNLINSAVKSSSKTLSDTDATNRSIIEPLVLSSIQKSLDEKYGENIICINKVIINNADFEDSYNKAIAAKQKAQLDSEKQAIKNQKAIDKAKADALVVKTKAEANANAKVIAAQAEVKANKLLENSLTEQILRKSYIERWNGVLPQYVSGDNASVMFGINTK